MIGWLRGRLAAKTPPTVVLDVNGVGYECEAPMSTFFGLPETGTEITLRTHLVVREDAHILYAFATEDERRRGVTVEVGWCRVSTPRLHAPPPHCAEPRSAPQEGSPIERR